VVDPNEIDVSGAVALDHALAVVQKTLDRLVARGQESTAFEVARAQFRASMRASWPANTSTLVALLANLERDAETKLDEAERAELSAAMAVLRNVAHP
jgi:hypothetical protein